MGPVLIRWTVGDVSARGFEAPGLSIAGAKNVFGADARYVVSVNTIPIETVRARVGGPPGVEWLQADERVPEWLGEHMDPGLAEGVGWKFAPLHVDPELPTIALDNDVVLWQMPESIRQWMEDADSLLIAEDVRACYGGFTPLCPAEGRNSGIRGIPKSFPLADRLRHLLECSGVVLRSEMDEQGLQTAMISREKHRVVTLEEVSICGYFRPHQLDLGSCGAHFVGVNIRKAPFEWNGRSGEEYVHGFWDSMKPDVMRRIWPGPVDPNSLAQAGKLSSRLNRISFGRNEYGLEGVSVPAGVQLLSAQACATPSTSVHASIALCSRSGTLPFDRGVSAGAGRRLYR